MGNKKHLRGLGSSTRSFSLLTFHGQEKRQAPCLKGKLWYFFNLDPILPSFSVQVTKGDNSP